MKNHLKRIATPRTWVLDRKAETFIVRPSPGAHPLDQGLPLTFIMRDVLGMAASSGEVQKILNNNEVLVDGKRRKNHRFIIGLFDVLAFPSLKKYYRVVLDTKGRLAVVEIKEDESTVKPCRVVGKTVVAGGKIQFNLHDGKNIISDKAAKVGDTLLVALPSLEIKEVIPLDANASVFLTKGKHAGDLGVVKEITGQNATYTKDGKDIETAKGYLFVVGKEKAAVTVQ